MQWQAKWVESYPEFTAAKAILEIGAGRFETIQYLAQKYEHKNFYALDFVISEAARANLSDLPKNLTIIKHDARDLNLFASEYFDLVYSVAVMEHIRELSQHLKETYRILNRGGSYCFWQAPFWSCSRGHHFRHGKPDCPIPSYAHLYMTREELVAELKLNPKWADRVETVCQFIFERSDLSRLGRSETRQLIQNSRFNIADWLDQPDDKYDQTGADRVLSRNLYRVPKEDLRIKGAKVQLQRVR